MNRTLSSLVAVGTCLSVLSPFAHAEPSGFEWIVSGGGEKNDKTRAVTFGPDGGVYLAGETTGDGAFGDRERKGLGGTDFFLARVSPEGGVLWVRSLGGSLTDRGYGVVTDPSGNAYVTGHFESTDARVDGELLPNQGDYDVFVAKFSPEGEVLWIRTAGGSGYDYGHGIALDFNGDVIVTGAVAGEARFGDTVINPGGTGRPIFCAKYSSEGELRWARGSSGGFSGSGHGIGVDAAGNLYLGGNGNGKGQFGDLAIEARGPSALVLKLDPSGEALWVSLTPGTPSTGFHEITVDAEGRIWCAGMFKGSVTFADQTWKTTGDKDSDGILAHFSRDGILQWSRAIQGPATDYCLGVATDGTGRVFVTGEFSGEATFAGEPLTSEGATDIFTAALGEAGGLQWCVESGGAKGDNAYTMAWHPDGRLVIGGGCTAPAAFGERTMDAPGAAQAYGAVLRID